MTNTRLAKLVYSLAGYLSKIKTRQAVYKMANENEWFRGDTQTVVWEKAGHRKLPCKVSHKLLLRSMKLDPVHWDHWALEHKGCSASYCMDCKGYSCGNGQHDLEDTL